MMKHTYKITGMTCSACTTKVKRSLLKLPDVMSVDLSLENNEATISMTRHIPVAKLQASLDSIPGNYSISEVSNGRVSELHKSWLETYKPVLLIFGYITIVTLLIQLNHSTFDIMQWMRHFMAGFFLVFSFFKLLDLKGFAESYVTYDVIAKRFPGWSYAYVFIELALGIAFLVDFIPLITSIVTFVVMSVSLIGVMKTILNKRVIQCACLGAVFNLPMSTVTIVEDALMIAMSAVMILMLF